MKKGELDTNGFTIIEVSLVLAIAGLIFLMVFVALPALQRQQRDTRRRESVMSLISQIKKYQSNNRGALPTPTENGGKSETAFHGGNSTSDSSWQAFYDDYLKGNFIDPDGDNYVLRIEPCGMSIDANCINSQENHLDKVYESDFPYTYNNSYEYTMLVITKATCSGDQAVGAANPRKIAVVYRLEGAGSYCANS